MDKKEFIKFLNEIFTAAGYKKKGNSWRKETEELIKVIILQKSYYGNFYYVNYGFIIRNLDLENSVLHVFEGLGSLDHNENEKIKNLLSFQNEYNDRNRKSELAAILKKNLLFEIELVNSENDLFIYLKKRDTLNDIFLSVKKYFNLTE